MAQQDLKLSVAASTILVREGAAMNELIEMILKGNDPVEIIQAARNSDATPGLKHVHSYIAGMSTGWAKNNKTQAIKEFRWELGYALMQLAYGEQPFNITPMERVK